MIWGRFLHDAWLKRKTYDAVTSRRVLILQEGWKRKASWMYLEAIPTIEREGTMTGTLWFGKKYPVIAGRGRKTRSTSRFDVGDVPVFADIDDVDGVQRLVQELRESARKESCSANRNDPGPLLSGGAITVALSAGASHVSTMKNRQTGMSVLLGGEFGSGGGEDFGVGVDVGVGGGGAHKGHVVEGGEEDAAV